MPLFTHESAVAAGLKSGEARRARSLIPVAGLVQPPMNELEKEMTRDTLEELRRCRDFLRQCRDPEQFVKLTAAKERLWNLVFPKPGTRKPKSLTQRPPVPVAVDASTQAGPTEQPAAVPVPDFAPALASPPTPAPVIHVTAPESALDADIPSGPMAQIPEASQDLKSALSLLYRRSPEQVWTYAEEFLLNELSRRPWVMDEFRLIVKYRRRMPYDERKFFPGTLERLLETWSATVARARGL
jgi:hypothetical protein